MKTGYKGFDKGLTCRRLKHRKNKATVFQGTPKLCRKGLHYCEKLIDVFQFYSPASDIYLVEDTGSVRDVGEEKTLENLGEQ